MAVITQLNSDSIATILQAYEVGTLVSYTPASQGIENSNFFVETSDGERRHEWVLTLLEQPSYAGEKYVEILDACHAAGLPVANIKRTTGGEAYTDFQGQRLQLTPRLTGHHVHHPTISQVSSVGLLVGRIHEATADLVDVPPYPRNLAWIKKQAQHLSGRVSYSVQALIEDGIAILTSLIGRQSFGELPGGVVHADLFRDNLLFDERSLTGALDFHHASHGHYLFDLAVAANDWCGTPDGSLDDARVRALLRAYSTTRTLTQHEQWYFGLYMAYAALVFLIARYCVVLDADEDTPVKNPEEFETIVRHRIRYPYDLDLRNL